MTRGRVAPHIFADLDAAGFTREQSLDVVLGVGVYLLGTLSDVLTAAPLDPAFANFAWTKPDAESHRV